MSDSRIDFGPARRVLRTRRLSTVVNSRVAVVAEVSALGCFGTFLLSVTLGDVKIPVAEVFRILTGENTGFDTKVVLDWRLPRAVAGVVFGAALGVSGALFQSLTRNPLGSPDVIGLGAGAYTGALIAVLVTGGRSQITLYSLIGGILTAFVVYVVAYRGGVSGLRFVVVGIAVSSALTAVNSLLLLRMSTQTAMAANIRGQGTLAELRWSDVTVGIALVIPLMLLALAGAPLLAQLELGDTPAAATGVSVERSRMLLLGLGVLLTAVVTSVTGPIGFISLVAPQVARLLSGSGGATLTGSAATGALLLSLADVLGSNLFSVSLPVGVVTAVIGGAYLAWLIIREARGRQ